MKIKTIKYVFSVLLIIFAFTSCDKNDISIDESKTTETKDILAFSTMADFEKTLTKVNAMTKEERLSWEKEQGFKSFGTICDEFYETINPKTFKSIDEVETFVEKNSDKIEFYTSSDGETYCVTKGFLSAEKYLINKQQACKIGSEIVIFSNSQSSLIDQSLFMRKAANAVVTEADASGNCVIKGPGWFDDDTYRVHAWIKTELVNGNDFYTKLTIKNFSLSAGIWWFIEAPITYTFNYTISDSNNTRSNNASGGSWITNSNSSPFFVSYFFDIPNASSPYFTKYYCKVVNTITDSNGTGHCTATMSK